MNYTKLTGFVICLFLIIVFLYCPISFARTRVDFSQQQSGTAKTSADCLLNVEYAVHNVGKIGLTVANMGHFGTGFLDILGASQIGEAPSCKYPYPGNVNYMFAGSFWIGAISGRDTLVSVGADGWHLTMEMWPAPYPEGKMVSKSLSNPEDYDAISEQDIISVYVDTVTDPACVEEDSFDNRPHRPLNIRVTQRSYAWSYSYAEDFVLFDYSIENIGRKTLENVYMGIYVDGHVGLQDYWDDAQDDICGFRRSVPSIRDCPGMGWRDTINIAWIADCDGKRNISAIPPCPSALTLSGITGTRVIRTPNADTLKYSFNWWVSNPNALDDFGPRLSSTPEDPWRDFGGNLGTPMGDRNKYYIMRHEEFDYDQLFTARDNTNEGWLAPPAAAADISDGFDTRYLLSFGPFDIFPGEILPITFAYVAGEDFHTDCDAYDNLYNPLYPELLYDNFDFNDLGKNSVWASWIYDNPGVDTDDNGFRGPMRFCFYDSILVDDTSTITVGDSIWFYTDVDTVYTAGDGIPDFRGASPPPPPEMWVINSDGDTLRSKVIPRVASFNQGELSIRWNGKKSETEKDNFSDEYDFEGYKVYYALSPSGFDREWTLLSSYDRDDYNRYTWNNARGLWELLDVPFTLKQLKAMYGDSFDPSDYDTPENIFTYLSSQYYFGPQWYNRSDLSDPYGIHKIYPDEPAPSTLSLDSARLYYPEQLTEDGLFFKYYEYEYVFRNLLPSQLYYVAVTAFDYGSPASGLDMLETRKILNYVAEYPLSDNTTIKNNVLDVVVYPNPWRIDGQYKDFGFEGRDYIDGTNQGHIVPQDGYPDDRTRSIHFINLPHKCTIKIFTIDGDLVREIDHDYPEDSPRSMHERWDLITRNTQAVVSGIYYYSVESTYGNQIGKIVIIM